MEITFDRASRQKLFMQPADETHLGRVCFSVACNTRFDTRNVLRDIPKEKKNKDTLEILLDTAFEDTLQIAMSYFRKYSDLLTEDEFLNGFLLLKDWNKDLKYPTVYDILLDSVEQWQQYHFLIKPGPSKDAWIALLAEKMKWPKDRLQAKPFLKNNHRIWYPFATNEELNDIFLEQEVFLQVGSLQRPERIYLDQIYVHESNLESLTSSGKGYPDKRSRYLCSVGRRTLRTWKEMAKNPL